MRSGALEHRLAVVAEGRASELKNESKAVRSFSTARLTAKSGFVAPSAAAREPAAFARPVEVR